MLKSLLRGLAEVVFTAATLVITIGITLIVFGSWLIVKSPRERKLRAVIHLGTTALSTAQSLRDNADRNTG